MLAESGVAALARSRHVDIDELGDATGFGRHHDDPVCERHRLGHVVRDEQDGLAGRPPRRRAARAAASPGSGRRPRQTARPLRVVRGRPRATARWRRAVSSRRERLRVRVAELGEPDEVEHLVDPLCLLRLSERSLRSSPKPTFSSTVSHGNRWYSWKTTPMSVVGPVTRVPAEADLAVGGLRESGDDPEQRRLPAAGGADETDELPSSTAKGDVVERADGITVAVALVRLPDAVDGDAGLLDGALGVSVRIGLGHRPVVHARHTNTLRWTARNATSTRRNIRLNTRMYAITLSTEVVARAQDLAADAGHAEYLGGDDEHPAASEPGADPGRDPRHRRREDDRSDHVEVAAHAERPAHVE